MGRKKWMRWPAVIVAVVLLAVGWSSCRNSDEGATAGPEPDAPAQTVETSPEQELDDLVVTFIDVGQGDSELVELPDGRTMLVDAGEASSVQAVKAAVDASGGDIDIMVATHPHNDHIGGMQEILAAYQIDEMWMPDAPGATETYESLIDALTDRGIDTGQAVAGESIVDADAGYAVDVLAPGPGVSSDDMNDYSAIIKITYGDTSVLLTGDAPARSIVDAQPGDVDVLKAAHHGSQTGTDAAVLDATKPETVILSYAEGNSYGHPDQSVLDAIGAAGAMAYSTAANGNVTVTSDGEDVTVATDRDGTITAGESAEARAQREAQEQAQREAEEQARREAEEQARMQAEQQAQQQAQERIVYVTPTGEKYHKQGCRTLSRTKTLIPMTEADAIAAGYGPCGVCGG